MYRPLLRNGLRPLLDPNYSSSRRINRKMGVENKIPLIFELPVDRSRETPAILIEKKWKRERGEAFN